MSSNYIQTVAIVGASGNSGKHMTESLVKTGKHKVIALTRRGGSSEIPAGVEARNIDYDDKSTLVSALQGVDALVITLSVQAPPGTERKLIDAAAEAGVPFIMPNEWGYDSSNEQLNKDTVIGVAKRETEQYIESLGKSAWIALACGFWYEWSLSIPIAYGINIEKREAVLYDGGDIEVSTSTWPQVGRAVAALLSLPISGASPCIEDYKSRHVYVTSFDVTQKDMLESAIRVTGTTRDDWKISTEPAKERYEAGQKLFQSGDRRGFGKMLYARYFYPDNGGSMRNKPVQNDVLGLPKEDLDEFTKLAWERTKQAGFADLSP